MTKPRLRALYWLLACVCIAVVVIVIVWVVLKPGQSHNSSVDLSTANPPAVPKPKPGIPWFENVTRASGIDFHHFDSQTPIHYMQETLGSGVAWIDYNNDGWPDLLCVQDGPVFPDKSSGSLPTSRLYRNNGDGTFTDVTTAVGLDQPGYGMGCAVGDYDNDGFDDLLVTYFGRVALYHNEPDGKGGRRFVDVTAKAGLMNPHFATSCAWGDIDGDGFLDLYICNYVEMDLARYPFCGDQQKQIRGTCPPSIFPNVTHKLYRNNGNGTFTDISKESGIAAAPAAPGLGVVMTDLDGDGKLDIYVANDMKPAYLFHNQGGGRFVEKGMFSGAAVGPLGALVAGMGVDAGDVDGTGRPSLFVTNFQNKPNILYRNKGKLLFQEWSNPSGLGAPSLHRLGFGTVFFDADLDGILDVAVANGHVHRTAMEMYGVPYAQEAQLFLGQGGGKFRDISDQCGEYFRQRHVGRGLAWADYDNDGRPDLVVSHTGEPIALLHNSTETGNNWIRLELVGDGKKSNRNAIGAKIEIDAGGKKQTRFINGGGSYLSASERRQLVGLGSATQADRVAVTWPSGRKQEFKNLSGKQWWKLTEGEPEPKSVQPLRPVVRSE